MLCVAFFFHFINLMHFLHTYVLLIKVVFLFQKVILSFLQTAVWLFFLNTFLPYYMKLDSLVENLEYLLLRSSNSRKNSNYTPLDSFINYFNVGLNYRRHKSKATCLPFSWLLSISLWKVSIPNGLRRSWLEFIKRVEHLQKMILKNQRIQKRRQLVKSTLDEYVLRGKHIVKTVEFSNKHDGCH